VVGTNFYQENLRRLAGMKPGGKPVRVAVTAVLVAEDADPHDRNAVAVWINGLQVGHLAREDATRYRPGLLALQQARQRPVATDMEDARLAHQRNYNHRFMNCGRGSAEIVTVIGTSRFQQALRQAAATPRPWRHNSTSTSPRCSRGCRATGKR
jgi:hypothetical protein